MSIFNKTRNYFIVATSLILLHFSFTLPAFSATSNPTMEEFVARQKTIRIYMDHSLLGLGNQTKSYNLMRRLWQVGFNGTFEVIYSRYAVNSVITLFGLPSDIKTKNIYEYEYNDIGQKRKIIFIELLTYYDQLKTKKLGDAIDFAASGFEKSSPPCNIIDFEQKDDTGTSDVDFDAPICNNLANFANAKTFTRFNTFLGDSDTGAAVGLSILDQGNEKILPGSGKKFFITPTFTLNQSEDYLRNNPQGQALIAQKPALNTFINTIQNQTANILPAYGWSLAPSPQEINFPGNVLQVILGARFAQLNGPAAMHKPLIIAVFSDYQIQAEQLLKIIQRNDWGSFYAPESESINQIIVSSKLGGQFAIANLADAKTSEIIRQLKPEQILLLTMGPLPKIVFDGLYTHQSDAIWPQIREGVSSFDSLSLTGKPHIRCTPENNGWEIGLDLLRDTTLKSFLEKFYGFIPADADEFIWRDNNSHFCEHMKTWRQYQNIYQDVGKLMIDGMNSTSAFSLYFKQLELETKKPENDRIRYAIEEAIKSVNRSTQPQ